MAIITAEQEKNIKKAMLDAVLSSEKEKFDDKFKSFFAENLKNMKLKRRKRYTATFIGKADGEARCSYEDTLSGEPHTFYTDVSVIGIPFSSYNYSWSPLSEEDVSSEAGIFEITKEVQRRMNKEYGYNYKILSVKRTDVRVQTTKYFEYDEYIVQFKYRNREEQIYFDGKRADSLETTYKPTAQKIKEVEAKIVSVIVPFLLMIAGFALYVFAAMDFCRGGNTVKVILAIVYGAIIFYPFLAVLACMKVHLKYSIQQDSNMLDYMLVALETFAVLGLFALTAYLGFFLEI